MFPNKYGFLALIGIIPALLFPNILYVFASFLIVTTIIVMINKKEKFGQKETIHTALTTSLSFFALGSIFFIISQMAIPLLVWITIPLVSIITFLAVYLGILLGKEIRKKKLKK